MNYLEAFAEISRDGVYRYRLTRRLSPGNRTVLFVGLNPSTADATHDDQTIKRCVGYARAWGYDVLLMGNLHAYRATDPIDQSYLQVAVLCLTLSVAEILRRSDA